MWTVTSTDDPKTPENDAGRYSFQGVAGGEYVVTAGKTDGWRQTFPEPPVSEFNIVVRFTDNSLSPNQQMFFENAARRGIPAVAVVTGGGVRIQEGVLSLMQLAKTVTAATRQRHADGAEDVAVIAQVRRGVEGVNTAMPGIRIAIDDAAVDCLKAGHISAPLYTG